MPATNERVTDPVCGMSVDRNRSPHQAKYKGEQFSFCAAGCKQAFEGKPEYFLTHPPSKSNMVSSASAGSNTGSVVGLLDIAVPSEPAAIRLSPTESSPVEPILTDGASRIALPVIGMHCASCVAAIEDAVGEDSGVSSAVVNFATERLSVDFDPERTSLTRLAERVSAAGDYRLILPIAGERVEDIEQTQRLRETRTLRRRLVVALVASAVVMAAPLLVERLVGGAIAPALLVRLVQFVQLAAASVALFWAGRGFLSGFWVGLKHFRFNMDSLIALGTGAAYAYSLVAVVAPRVLGLDSAANSGLYFDTTCMILALVLLGKLLESRAKGKASEAVKKLLELQPAVARLVLGDNEREIPVEQVRVGDLLAIRPGEKIPLDGSVTQGESSVNEAHLSGESLPVDKDVGAAVFAGSINLNGALRVEVTRASEDTTLAQIIQLVQRAQGSKAPVQRLADRISSIFVPAVLLIAFATFGGWLIFSGSLPWALSSAIAVLIIACPCALGLATPTAIVTASGRGAELGLLVRSAETLEVLHEVKDVLLDKTGTITEGQIRVTDVLSSSEHDTRTLLMLAATVESQSEHPIGRAIVDYAVGRGILPKTVESFEALPGRGAVARMDGRRIAVGNTRLAEEFDIALGSLQAGAEQLAREAKTAVFVLEGDSPVGIIGVADAVRSDSARAIETLNGLGVRPVMLTGDSNAVAQAIAAEVGIESVYADVLPNEKAKTVADLQDSGGTVAMVGDGINDAPALAQANVGIAIGSGTDVAIEASDVTLVNGTLTGVGDAIRLSRTTMRIIRQNLFWAFFYNVLGIPLASGVLYPVFGWRLSPVIAAFAMAASSLTVVANALRLKRFV